MIHSFITKIKRQGKYTEKFEQMYYILCIKQNLTFLNNFVILNNNPLNSRYIEVKSDSLSQNVNDNNF